MRAVQDVDKKRPDTNHESTIPWLELGFVACLALVVRTLVVLTLADDLQADPDAYHAIANGIRSDGVFGVKFDAQTTPAQPTAYRPPLYPILLSLLGRWEEGYLGLIAVFHVLLGCGTASITCYLGCRWLQRFAGVIAGSLVAIDPLLLLQSTLTMTETLATFLATLCLLALHRDERNRSGERTDLFGPFAVGAAFGIAALCRPSFLPWGLCIGLLWISQSVFKKESWWRPVLFAATTLALLAPWGWRNQQVLYPPGDRMPWQSRPVMTTTHGGYTLLLGNNATFYAHIRDQGWHQVWSAESPNFVAELNVIDQEAREELVSQLSLRAEHRRYWMIGRDQQPRLSPAAFSYLETHRDARSYQHAFAAISTDPMMFVQACLLRVYRFWTPLPNQTEAEESRSKQVIRYGVAIWYAAIYAACAYAVATSRQRLVRMPWLTLALFALSLTLLHAFYWSNIRMRAPLIPVISILAAQGLFSCYERLRKRKRSARESTSS